MMKRWTAKILILIFILIVGYLVVTQFFCSPSGMAPEIISVDSVKIKNMTEELVELSITVTAVNHNGFGVSIKEMNSRIEFEKDSIGSSVREDEFSVPGNDTVSVSMDVLLITDKIASILNEKIDTVHFNLKGSLNSEVAFITMPVDFDIPVSIPLKEHLQKSVEAEIKNKNLISVRSASLKKASLKNSFVLVKFNIKNPYNVDVEVIDYTSEIFINNDVAGTGNIDKEKIPVKAGTTSTGEVTYKLKNLNLVTSIFGSILNRKLTYRTSGILTLRLLKSEISFPYRFEGVLIKI